MRTFNISPARRFRIRVTEVKEQTSPEPQDDHLYAIAGWFSKEASMIPTRFGRKLKLPSTAQIKHEVLVGWLADQTAKEDLESKPAAKANAPTTRTAPVDERKKGARQKTKDAAMPNA